MNDIPALPSVTLAVSRRLLQAQPSIAYSEPNLAAIQKLTTLATLAHVGLAQFAQLGDVFQPDDQTAVANKLGKDMSKIAGATADIKHARRRRRGRY